MKNLKTNFFAKIIPYKYIKFSLWIMFLLFFSPILVICAEPSLIKDTKTLNLVIWTLCISFCLYTILIGFVLVFYKNPFMQELKEKLGYNEV